MNDVLLRSAIGMQQAGNLKEAARLYGEILKADPRNFHALYYLAYVHYRNGDIAAAERLFADASRADPRHADALINRGMLLRSLGRREEALSSYEKALALKPDSIAALAGRSAALYELKHFREALACTDECLTLAPDNVDVLVGRGLILRELDRTKEALASYDRALEIKADCIDALVNRSSLFYAFKRYEEAARDCARALELDPARTELMGYLAYYRLLICDWRALEETERTLTAGVRAKQFAVQPFMYLAFARSPADQLQCAKTWAARDAAAAPKPFARAGRYAHKRIRVAYLSGDFRVHPVAQLLAGVFECHDRERFEFAAVSFGEDDKSMLRRRIVQGLEHFVDVCEQDDGTIATLLREHEFDIVVDLMGFSGDRRTGILPHRPAPIQVNYLGFPGTTALDHMDYLIADRVVVPDADQRHYGEKIVYLPDCYMPQDATSTAPQCTPERAKLGLPADGVVFASFNNSYKFMPEMFGVWMRLLSAVKGSVLWLADANAAARRNLKREAERRGVEPQRLVFAPFAPEREDHLARLKAADLFLDTLPCNAQTTASDALVTGLPVLTCLGTTFAGRVAASLLHAVGLPELVTHSLGEYEVLALKLAREPGVLARVKAKLARNRDTTPLFDTAAFARHLEAAYTTMWERGQHGLEPASFAVARAP